MPRRVARPCKHSGCPKIVCGNAIYCDDHARQHQAEYDARRGSAAARGYDARWRRLRMMLLAVHPLCADPFGIHAQHGELITATEVDHIRPKQEGGIDDMDNLQALCKSCHSRKTTLENK